MNRTTRYTFVAFYLNSLLDEGLSLDYKETVRHLEEKTILDFLKDRFGSKIDLTLLDESDEKAVTDLFYNLVSVVNAQRKFGVRKNGISLLLAYCIEGVQEEYRKNRPLIGVQA
jgi:hypothetical protein